ncbi:MAG: GNAT family N-acetyltransferase [Bacteroidetes bacterium]|nr:GNAT family N-acetyltransferase [Bacteroidota bacterium]
MKFSIRDANVKDIEQLQFIRGAVQQNILSNPELITYEDYEAFISQIGKGWVAFTGKTILGFAIADMQKDNVWALFVHPRYENKSIGKKLHHTMLNAYFNSGKQKIWLSTEPGTRAEIFYNKQGWKCTGKLTNGEIRFEMTADEWRSQSN